MVTIRHRLSWCETKMFAKSRRPFAAATISIARPTALKGRFLEPAGDAATISCDTMAAPPFCLLSFVDQRKLIVRSASDLPVGR